MRHQLHVNQTDKTEATSHSKHISQIQVSPRPDTSTPVLSVNHEIIEKHGLSVSETLKLVKCADYSRAVTKPPSEAMEGIPMPLDISSMADVFPQLNAKDVERMMRLLEKSGCRIYINQTEEIGKGKIVFAAAGTKYMNPRDFMQNGQIFCGMKGIKMNPLEKLCQLMNKNDIKPDIYTGHSLGGLMAMAAYSAIEKHENNNFVPTVSSIEKAPEEDDRIVYIFDGAPANKKTKRAFNMSDYLGAQDNQDAIISAHLDSADSLREKVLRAMRGKRKSRRDSPPRLDLPKSIAIPPSHDPSSSSHKLTNIATSIRSHLLKRSENLEILASSTKEIDSNPIQKQIAQWQTAVSKFEQLARQLSIGKQEQQGEHEVTLKQIEEVMAAEENAMQELLNLNSTLKSMSNEDKAKHQDKIKIFEQLLKRLNTTKSSLASTMASPGTPSEELIENISTNTSQNKEGHTPIAALSSAPSNNQPPLKNNTENTKAHMPQDQSSGKGRVKALVDRFEAMK